MARSRVKLMQLTIGAPSHGWMWYHISIEGRSFAIHASNFVNDPLPELLMAAIWALDSDTELPPVAEYLNPPLVAPGVRGIHFWTEPKWHSLLVLKPESIGDVRIRFYEDHEGGLSVDEHDLRMSAFTLFDSLPALQFAKMVHAAISETFTAEVIESYDRLWRRGFPFGLLADLSALLRQL